MTYLTLKLVGELHSHTPPGKLETMFASHNPKGVDMSEFPIPVASMPMATPEVDIEPDTSTSPDLPWVCIVWDDPVNLMSYVTYVFETVLGYGRARATELMMTVHTKGKAVVSSGERDKVEADVKKLQTAGLWATMQRAEG